MELKEFQQRAIAELNAAMGDPNRREIVLKSPTGSGKTIILTHFMAGWMRDHANMAFVWLTPGEGNLEEQSKAKMDHYCRNAQTKLLADVMTGGFAAGDAVFINWQKLTMEGNNALKDGERTNFLEWIDKARSAGIAFKVVIDESHHSFTEKTDSVVRWFGTDKIVRASATPNVDPAAIMIDIPEEEVIASGLIKKMMHVNPGFPMRIDLDADTDRTRYLLEKAMAKRGELVAAFREAGSAVNPLVVVQLPNNSDALLQTVEEWFSTQGIDVAGGTFAVWLAKRKDNVEGLEQNDCRQVAVVIKQAVATGWDCPRAHILVKLRENMDERFEIQTIGRIRRMPEGRHYGNGLLDGCYLYTFDERFTAGVVGGYTDTDIGVKKLFIRSEHKAFSLTKEQRTSVAETRDAEQALKAVAAWFRRHYGLGPDFAKNQARLESNGYVFGDRIVDKTISGDARTTAQLKSASRTMNEVEVGVPVNTHRHGRDFHHCLGEIGAANALPYDDTRMIVHRVFGTKPDDKSKCLRLVAAPLYAFVINNAKRLRGDFTEAMAAEFKFTTSGDATVEKEFRFPHEWLCAYSAKASNQDESAKNVYAGYPKSAMTMKTRSKGEMKFEKWCESHGEVKWVYRNGDKGDEFFSIVYEDNSGHQRLFFPDYVLSVCGKVWIVEVKGGWSGSGKSENIDPYAVKKAAALNDYCARQGLGGGLVCHDEEEDILKIALSGYSEDVQSSCWQPLDDVIISKTTHGAETAAMDTAGDFQYHDIGESGVLRAALSEAPADDGSTFID